MSSEYPSTTDTTPAVASVDEFTATIKPATDEPPAAAQTILTWEDDETGITSYLIESSANGQDWDKVSEKNGDAREHTISSEAGLAYRITSCKDQEPSEPREARYVPASVVNLAAKIEGNKTILTWDDKQTGVSYYEIQRRVTSNDKWERLHPNQPANAESYVYTHDGGPTGTLGHELRVIAFASPQSRSPSGHVYSRVELGSAGVYGNNANADDENEIVNLIEAEQIVGVALRMRNHGRPDEFGHSDGCEDKRTINFRCSTYGSMKVAPVELCDGKQVFKVYEAQGETYCELVNGEQADNAGSKPGIMRPGKVQMQTASSAGE